MVTPRFEITLSHIDPKTYVREVLTELISDAQTAAEALAEAREYLRPVPYDILEVRPRV